MYSWFWKLFCNQPGHSKGRWKVTLPFLLWHLAQLGCQSCQPFALATLQPPKIPWYSFLLEAKWTPRLLNEDRRIKSPEKFPWAQMGIKPRTCHDVAQCLNQPFHYNKMYYKVIFLLSALCLLYLYLIQNHDQDSQKKYYLMHMQEYGVIHDLMS